MCLSCGVVRRSAAPLPSAGLPEYGRVAVAVGLKHDAFPVR